MHSKKNKIYFASDFHINDAKFDKERLTLITQWLREISLDAEQLILVGDIFDYWFEYKEVVPKNFFTFLFELKKVQESGTKIIWFVGNHDLWLGDFIKEELQITVCYQPKMMIIKDKIFYIAHGDGLGPEGLTSKILRFIMTNTNCQKLFSLIHPNLGLKIMRYFSQKSRDYDNQFAENTKLENWYTYIHAQTQLVKHPKIDYFVFGHMHACAMRTMDNKLTKYVNLGEWISQRSYAMYDGERLKLEFFKQTNAKIIY